MSKKKPEWWEQSVPLIIPQTYLRVAADRGASISDLLARAGLPPGFADHPSDLPMPQVLQLVVAVREAVGDNGLGLDIGWHLPPTAFGNFGYALLCSETLQDALDLCRRYWHLVARGTVLSLREQGDYAIAQVSLSFPFPEPMRHAVFETTFASVYHGLQLLAGSVMADIEIWFDFPQPDYADKARQLLGNVRYDMPVNQARFPLALLNTRLSMHNPTGLHFALEQLEREDALSEAASNQVASRVRERLVFSTEGYPGLEAMSRQLHMTARTLRRRLDQEGASYKTLLEEAKRRDAIRLLDDYSLDIQKVAGLLGYQDPANFTRAFRQWTGQTPSQYRHTRQTD